MLFELVGLLIDERTKEDSFAGPGLSRNAVVFWIPAFVGMTWVIVIDDVLYSDRKRLLINLQEKLQDPLLAWGGGIGGHIHRVLGGIKSNFLQVFFGDALSL
jgi:hypothetical protein